MCCLGWRVFGSGYGQVPARVPKRAPLVELVLTMTSMRGERKDKYWQCVCGGDHTAQGRLGWLGWLGRLGWLGWLERRRRLGRLGRFGRGGKLDNWEIGKLENWEFSRWEVTGRGWTRFLGCKKEL